jgi:hypothetical protein
MIIKIGRDDIEVKKGDYITFDGEKYALLSGEYPPRPLKIQGKMHYCFLTLPKKTFQKIPKDILHAIKQKDGSVKWKFKDC